MVEQTNNQQPSISLDDIQFMINYIDMTIARGAGRGEELLEIGTRRDRFVKFLTFAQEQMKKQENDQPQGVETLEKGNV